MLGLRRLFRKEEPTAGRRETRSEFSRFLTSDDLAVKPEDWTSYRSSEKKCELWFPADWSVDDGGSAVIVRPPSTRTLEDHDGRRFRSPIVSVIAGTVAESVSEDQFVEEWSGNHASGYAYRQFESISADTLQLSGHPAFCGRFRFRRNGSVLEAFTLLRVRDRVFWHADANGVTEDIREHRPSLVRILAGMKVFDTPAALGESGGDSLVAVNQDTAPDTTTLGILFDVPCGNDVVCYSRHYQEEFFKALAGRRLGTCRISAGYVLPKVRHFCVKVEASESGAVRCLRRLFGPGSSADSLAPSDRRFVSGRPLERFALPFKGVLLSNGSYQGAMW